MKTICVALLAAIALGCGSNSDDKPPIKQPDVDKASVDAQNYDIGYTVCSGVIEGSVKPDPSNTADPETNPEAFAESYASTYEDTYRQAAYDGCLDALNGREKRSLR